MTSDLCGPTGSALDPLPPVLHPYLQGVVAEDAAVAGVARGVHVRLVPEREAGGGESGPCRDRSVQSRRGVGMRPAGGRVTTPHYTRWYWNVPRGESKLH